MSESNTVSVELTVAFVGSGGNARNGKYSYSYTPDFVAVTNPDTILQYSLSAQTDSRFVIDSYAVNDPTGQLSEFELKNGVLTMKNAVTQQNQLILLSVLVKDTIDNDIIDCDPEVTNVPPPQ